MYQSARVWDIWPLLLKSVPSVNTKYIKLTCLKIKCIVTPLVPSILRHCGPALNDAMFLYGIPTSSTIFPAATNTSSDGHLCLPRIDRSRVERQHCTHRYHILHILPPPELRLDRRL